MRRASERCGGWTARDTVLISRYSMIYLIAADDGGVQ